jgi:AcrR family transcriptional regulator
MKVARRYEQRARAEAAAQTEERILAAAEQLFSTEVFDRVTLDAVAKAADVTIPTVQRKFGNKEGLFEAAGARIRARVQEQRQAPGGTVDAELRALLAHYEAEGAMVWHLLKQEDHVPALRAPLGEARAFHRAWVERVFAQSLRSCRGEARARQVDALVAATDLYVWRLLRVDLGRTRAQVAQTMQALVQAITRGDDA